MSTRYNQFFIFLVILSYSIITIVVAVFYYPLWFQSISTVIVKLKQFPCQVTSDSNVLCGIFDNVHICSLRSTLRGDGQRVFAISVFGPKENDLFHFNQTLTFLYELIEETQLVFPNWILRIYHDATIPSTIVYETQDQHQHVDFCDMRNHSLLPPKTWRFLPMGDPLVDAMGSRDLDSPFTQREKEAVNEWLSSNKLFHIMRDHPEHNVNIMGGMWGYRPKLNPSLSQFFLGKLRNVTLMQKYGGTADQDFLENEVWPFAKSNILMHDSFHCEKFPGLTHPFPTQRPSMNTTNLFVGCIKPCNRFRHPLRPCPVMCRPERHKDWIYC